MKLLQFLVSFVLATTLWSACKDHSGNASEKTTQVTFAGRIIDENDQPLSGAAVQAGDEVVTTDINGVFRLPTVRLTENDARLHVRKPGYFEFSRAYILADGALQPVTIQLLTKTQTGSIMATQGGLVQVSGGPTLNFPANSVTTANGGSYSGTVLVYAHYLDPAAPDLALFMPGDLRGINTAGEDQSLGTYGMLAVEITGAGGEALKIAEGSTVEMTMPIDASQLSGAPASIPLWYFDLEKARWIEEGLAQKVGNQYVGKVKHFSCWNYDATYPSVILHGNVYIEDLQHPLANATIWVGPADLGLGWGFGHGTSDLNGYFGGAIPQGILLRMEVFNYGLGGTCGNQTVYSQIIGPFSSDVILPPIILTANPQVNYSIIAGRLLDCNNQPVSNGYVQVELITGNKFNGFTEADGSFELNVAYCTSSNITGLITGYDLNSLLSSTTQSLNLSASPIQIGDIPVCTMLDEYIHYVLDGQNITVVQPYAVSYSSGQTFYTHITTFDSLQNTSAISFYFYGDQQPGTYPISGLDVDPLVIDTQNIHINTTVSYFGTVGEPIVGTFDGTFQSLTGTSHTITGSYRVLRQ